MSLTRALRALTKPTDVLWLRETLGAQAAGGRAYEVVILDTAAALSVYTMNALVASRRRRHPSHARVPARRRRGADVADVRARALQAQPGSQAEPRFLLTQVDARLNRHARYAAYMRDKYGDAVMPDGHPDVVLASPRPRRDGRTVFDVEGEHVRGADDYAATPRSEITRLRRRDGAGCD